MELPHHVVVYLSGATGEQRAVARLVTAQRVVLEAPEGPCRGARVLLTFTSPGGGEVRCTAYVERWVERRRSRFHPQLRRLVLLPGRFVLRLVAWEAPVESGPAH
jgi:hypothetical protein